ncbi:MAG: YgjV family protein [Acidobacteria bacterium]|nr:YgjV family protein [Acidobacteriota bacterium]
MKPDWIGWVATAAFTSSYFVRNPFQIRAIQAIAAFLWLSYGVVIGAMPVIIANFLVISAALFTMWRDRRAQ